ncbi:AraC family transcriptional regulator [Paenibacillus gansuensis]|uniref:AraC family transcriptional regulator n=1 Tax=Paenibacillus gansuensis TaxID=306542 RepID=A0ABW5PHY3_9BACL
MKWNAKKDKSFYSSLFTVLTITIVATIIILSTILYLNFESIVAKQTYEHTIRNLEQTSQDASVMAVTASSFAKQIYNDVQVTRLLNNIATDPVDLFNLISQLNAYRATSPFIDSIYIYNAKTRTFYISSDLSSALGEFTEQEVVDREAVDIVHHLDLYKPLMPIPRQMKVNNITNPLEKKRDMYTFLLFDTLSNKPRQNTVIVNVSETQLHKKIDGLLTQSESNTFIIDSSGTLMSNSWKYPILSDISNKAFVSKILHQPSSSGYVREKVDGVDSFISFTQPDSLGWRYIRIMPYHEVMERIESMRWKTISIAATILLIGLLISYLISSRMFRKVDRKLAQLSQLETERRDSIHILRQEYMRNVLLGWEKCPAGRAEEQFKRYSVPLRTDQPMAMALLKIDHYHDFTERYNNDDRKLYKFAIMNIAQEVLSVNTDAFAVDMGEDRIAVILGGAALMADHADSALLKEVKKLQFAVKDWLKMSVSAVCSGPADSLDHLHALYNQVLSASYHRLFYGHECVIDAEKVEGYKSKKYVYPQAKEKQLIDELMLGRIEEVKRQFRAIIEETAEYSFVSFQLAFSQLSLAVNNTISTIGQYSFQSEGLGLQPIHTVVNDQVETLEEILKRFNELFDELASKLDEKRKSKHDDLVQSITQIVDERFGDPDLSLDVIADELGLSSTYIGRIYKQHTMKTILGYISEVRMNKARELLHGTNESIGDIAERIGYANGPYFFKAFKKANGVTPAEYRKHVRQQQDTSGTM